MSLTDAEAKRITTIENNLAKHAKAIKNLAAKKQLAHTITLLRTEIESMKTRLDSLESQLSSLKE